MKFSFLGQTTRLWCILFSGMVREKHEKRQRKPTNLLWNGWIIHLLADSNADQIFLGWTRERQASVSRGRTIHVGRQSLFGNWRRVSFIFMSRSLLKVSWRLQYFQWRPCDMDWWEHRERKNWILQDIRQPVIMWWIQGLQYKCHGSLWIR